MTTLLLVLLVASVWCNAILLVLVCGAYRYNTRMEADVQKYRALADVAMDALDDARQQAGAQIPQQLPKVVLFQKRILH